MPNPLFLNEATRSVAENAPIITKEDLAALRKIKVVGDEYKEPSDVLTIDMKAAQKVPELADFVFAWLNPEHRRRSGRGMGHWRWVTGELADILRTHKVVTEAVGASAAHSIIQNGDLILAFMPRAMHDARVAYMEAKNREIMKSVRAQQMGQGELGRHTEMISDVTVRSTYEGRDTGEV